MKKSKYYIHCTLKGILIEYLFQKIKLISARQYLSLEHNRSMAFKRTSFPINWKNVFFFYFKWRLSKVICFTKKNLSYKQGLQFRRLQPFQNVCSSQGMSSECHVVEILNFSISWLKSNSFHLKVDYHRPEIMIKIS